VPPPFVDRARYSARRLLSVLDSDSPSEDDSAAATKMDITWCYRLLLGREPEDHGQLGYEALLGAGGITRRELVGFFLSSPEFTNRLLGTYQWAIGAPQAVSVGPLTYYVDSNDTSIGAHLRQAGQYEPDVTAEIRRLLKPGQRFVDVGASFGYFATLAGSIVGPEGEVIAFEPGPQNQSLLLLNLAKNGVVHPEVHAAALSDAPGFLTYSSSGANGFITPFSGDPSELATRALVRAETLDAVIGERRVDMIKIDVEGAEGRVLKGGKVTIDRSRPILLMEFSPPSLESTSGMSGEDVLNILMSVGYQFDIVGSSPRKAKSPTAIMAAFAATTSDHIDIIAWVD